MPEFTDPTRLERVAELFQRHGVQFIVIGGQAEYLMGSPRVTYDVDVCYRRDPENLRKLAAALAEFGVRLRGVPAGLPFILDAKTLEMGSNFTFETPIGGPTSLAGLSPLVTSKRLRGVPSGIKSAL